MQLTITIDCDNAAFERSVVDEVARIMETQVLPHIAMAGEGRNLTDVNGNTVGQVSVTD